MTTLQVTWFLLVGVLLTGYAILDGFDLGAGFWHLFTKKDEDRRKIINSIGPVWDGNEVWLLTGGGAIFAAFPPVYASVFSGFYLALMLLLAALIFRAVAIEFRSKVESQSWRKSWDLAFGLGSTVAALLLGVALGNILRGVPLDANGNYTGTFFGLLNPYSLVIGLTGLAMILTHGGLYIAMKTDGELSKNARGWAQTAWIAYIVLFIASAGYTFAAQSQLLTNYNAQPVLYAIPILGLLSLVGIKLFASKGQIGRAFISSSVSIASMMGLVGAAIFPNLVPALGAAERSLTVFNSSSSQYTLTAMLILALIGVPIVLGYTIWTYKLFAGKVEADSHGY